MERQIRELNLILQQCIDPYQLGKVNPLEQVDAQVKELYNYVMQEDGYFKWIEGQSQRAAIQTILATRKVLKDEGFVPALRKMVLDWTKRNWKCMCSVEKFIICEPNKPARSAEKLTMRMPNRFVIKLIIEELTAEELEKPVLSCERLKEIDYNPKLGKGKAAVKHTTKGWIEVAGNKA